MPQNPADDLENAIKHSFVNPVQTALNAVNKIVPDSFVPKSLRNSSSRSSSSNSSSKPDTSWHDQMVENANKEFAAQAAKDKASSASNPPKYHKGTDYVPKTGPAILKKGEAVLNNEDANKYREVKSNMATKKPFDVSDELAGKKEEKPEKKIHHIKTRKAAGKGYIHTHVHTRPDAHPDEEHISSDQDEMADHMIQHMGEPNPGEAEADAGQSGIPANVAAAGPSAASTPQPTA